MMVAGDGYPSRTDIARHWYEEVYLPTVALIDEAGLPEMFGDMTRDDLFLWVADRWRKLFPERGPLTFAEVIREAAEEEAGKLSTKAKAVIGKVERVRKKPDEQAPQRPDTAG